MTDVENAGTDEKEVIKEEGEFIQRKVLLVDLYIRPRNNLRYFFIY